MSAAFPRDTQKPPIFFVNNYRRFVGDEYFRVVSKTLAFFKILCSIFFMLKPKKVTEAIASLWRSIRVMEGRLTSAEMAGEARKEEIDAMRGSRKEELERMRIDYAKEVQKFDDENWELGEELARMKEEKRLSLLEQPTHIEKERSLNAVIGSLRRGIEGLKGKAVYPLGGSLTDYWMNLEKSRLNTIQILEREINQLKLMGDKPCDWEDSYRSACDRLQVAIKDREDLKLENALLRNKLEGIRKSL